MNCTTCNTQFTPIPAHRKNRPECVTRKREQQARWQETKNADDVHVHTHTSYGKMIMQHLGIGRKEARKSTEDREPKMNGGRQSNAFGIRYRLNTGEASNG